MTGSTPPPDLLDQAARIIDPEEYRRHQSMLEYCLAHGDSAEEARATADWAHGKSIVQARSKAARILELRPGAQNSAPNDAADFSLDRQHLPALRQALQSALDRATAAADHAVRAGHSRDVIEAHEREETAMRAALRALPPPSVRRARD